MDKRLVLNANSEIEKFYKLFLSNSQMPFLNLFRCMASGYSFAIDLGEK